MLFYVRKPVKTLGEAKKSRKYQGILATVQISPRNKINIYFHEDLKEDEVEYATNVLKSLIVNEFGSEIELIPSKALAISGTKNPEWLNRIYLQLELPIRFTPSQRQMIVSTFKRTIMEPRRQKSSPKNHPRQSRNTL